MTTEVEQKITESMQVRAGGDVDVVRLRQAAMARATRSRRRRSLAGIAAITALVGVGALAVPTLLPGTGGFGIAGAPAVESSAPPGPSRSFPPPAKLPAANVPGAAQRPDTVATDPGVLHFDIDLAAAGASGVSWTSGEGKEAADLWMGSGGAGDYLKRADIIVARDSAALSNNVQGRADSGSTPPEPITVNGHPGTIQRNSAYWGGTEPVWHLTWQPADGLWAGVQMPAADAATVLTVARAVRFDRAQRCAVPIRLSALPPGARWVGCSTSFEPSKPTGRSWEISNLDFTNSQGERLSLGIGNYSQSSDTEFAANQTAAGRPAMWSLHKVSGTPPPEVVGTWCLFVPIEQGLNLDVCVMGEELHEPKAFSEADAIATANAVTISPDLNQPESWPARSVP